jgi:hypothetical protein
MKEEHEDTRQTMKHTASSVWLFLMLFAFFTTSGEAADSIPVPSKADVLVNADDLISAEIENKPLNEVVRLLSEKKLFEVRGTVPSGEPVSIHFIDLTLTDALKKIMRGYNYVLLNQPQGQKPILMVMGRTERTKPSDVIAVAVPVQPPSQALDPKSYYVPPDTLTEKAPIVPTRPRERSASESPLRTESPSPVNAPPANRIPQDVLPPDPGAKPAVSVGPEDGARPGSPASQGTRSGQKNNQDAQPGAVSGN